MSKVPRGTQRREERLSAAELLELPAKLIIHEDEVLYFDYGAVRLGLKPEPEDPKDPKPICVGLGWLPGWTFTMSERGLPDVVRHGQQPSSTSREKSSGTDDGSEEAGVLGLLYKMQIPGQPSMNRSLFQKKTTVDVKDLVFASAKDWDATIHFHDKHKLLKQTTVFLHLFDGAVGHKYQKDGAVVPFRTPGWLARVAVHIDPLREVLIRTKETQAAERRLQGQWVAKELEKWVKDANIPQAYVDDVLKEWIVADSGNQLKGHSGSSFRRFIGFGSE